MLSKIHLIDILHNLGVSYSYYEVLKFKSSAAAAAAENSKMIRLVAPREGIVQVVADNFDANISSQNGLLSTHSLAMLVTVPETNDKSAKRDDLFPRLSREEERSLEFVYTKIERCIGS